MRGRQLTLTFVRASKIGSLRTMMSVRDIMEDEDCRCIWVLWKADGFGGRVATSLTAFSALLASRGRFILATKSRFDYAKTISLL